MLPVDFHAAAGYVVREPSATDGRACGLHIAPAGRRRLADVTQLVREADRRAMTALTANAKRRLVELLENVGDLPENACRVGRVRPRETGGRIGGRGERPAEAREAPLVA